MTYSRSPIIVHYGVKGMHWGERKAEDEANKDPKRSVVYSPKPYSEDPKGKFMPRQLRNFDGMVLSNDLRKSKDTSEEDGTTDERTTNKSNTGAAKTDSADSMKDETSDEESEEAVKTEEESEEEPTDEEESEEEPKTEEDKWFDSLRKRILKYKKKNQKLNEEWFSKLREIILENKDKISMDEEGLDLVMSKLIKEKNEEEEDTLAHYGVKGMHWGIRRYQPYYGENKGKLVGEAARKAANANKPSNGKSENKSGLRSLILRKKSTEKKPEPPKKKDASEMTEEELSSEIRRLTLANQYKNMTSDKTQIKRASQMSDEELNRAIRRLETEKRYNDLLAGAKPKKEISKGRKFVNEVLESSGKQVATAFTTYMMGKAVNALVGDEVIKKLGKNGSDDDGEKKNDRSKKNESKTANSTSSNGKSSSEQKTSGGTKHTASSSSVPDSNANRKEQRSSQKRDSEVGKQWQSYIRNTVERDRPGITISLGRKHTEQVSTSATLNSLLNSGLTDTGDQWVHWLLRDD